MTINERVKELRKEKGLTQSEFGEKIGLKKSAISKLESDGNSVTDQNIRLICDTFRVREHWLRTGEGPKEAGDEEELWKKIREHFRLHGISEAIARAWFSLPEAERERFAEEAYAFAARIKDEMENDDAREAYKEKKRAELEKSFELQEEEGSSSSQITSDEGAEERA